MKFEAEVITSTTAQPPFARWPICFKTFFSAGVVKKTRTANQFISKRNHLINHGIIGFSAVKMAIGVASWCSGSTFTSLYKCKFTSIRDLLNESLSKALNVAKGHFKIFLYNIARWVCQRVYWSQRVISTWGRGHKWIFCPRANKTYHARGLELHARLCW